VQVKVCIYTGLWSFFHVTTGAGLPAASQSNETRRPTATDRLRGTDMNVGGAVNTDHPHSCRLSTPK